MRMVGGLAISLSLLKPPPPLKTKQRWQQICICGKSQTAGLDRAGMDGRSDEEGWGCRQTRVAQLKPAPSPSSVSFLQGLWQDVGEGLGPHLSFHHKV